MGPSVDGQVFAVSLHAPDSAVADDFATALEAVIASSTGPTT
jgi:thiamine biosynthesis lipoprotein ApbE